MRTLVYKRTHHGDPDISGQFGIHDCMGRVRTWDFEAVIGVGGLGAEPISHNLDGKINWIGIGPRKQHAPDRRGPIVTFDHFLFFGSEGPDFLATAPKLARRMYSRNVRVLMDGVDAVERKEVAKLLALAAKAAPSPARKKVSRRSTPRLCPRRPKKVKRC